MKYLFVCLILFVSTASSAQNSMPSVQSLDENWNSIATSGVCSAGTPHQFYVKAAAESSELLIFFNGGGGCCLGDVESCGFC